MTVLTIDPVTRLGGHLRIDVDVVSGVVADAWSSGTMFRGIERIVEGRDARDAWIFAQRVCGTCGIAHALASVRSMENALGLSVPTNARLIRNLMLGVSFVTSHVEHFYQRQVLDWVDVLPAVRADPAVTSKLARSDSNRPNSSPTYFADVRDRLSALAESGQLGPFANGYWGHPAYRLSAEEDLLILAHYLEALDWRRQVTRIQAMLGGKSPHPQTFLVGGMALAPEWTGPARPPGEHPWGAERISSRALSSSGLNDLASLIAGAQPFVEERYVPDVVRIGRAYPEWSAIGSGIGNYLSFGEFPADGSTNPPFLLPRGRVMADDASALLESDPSGVAETVAHSYYDDAEVDVNGGLRPPAEGLTNPRFSGPTTTVQALGDLERYSWLKAPRFNDDPMEVGPLARMVVARADPSSTIGAAFDAALQRVGIAPEQVGGTLGRTVARAVEAQVVVGALGGWLDELRSNLAGDLALANVTDWNPAGWPSIAQGVATGESPRGAVGHWVSLGGRWVKRYQIVDATTWNASPRDARGRRGALEHALGGTPVVDRDRPLEVLRTVHAFDPCPACAVHSFDQAGAGRPPVDIQVTEEADR